MIARILLLMLGLAGGATAGTQNFAWRYDNAAVLGPRWAISEDVVLYPPWSLLIWSQRFRDEAADAVAKSGIMLLLGGVGGIAVGSLAGGDGRIQRTRGWGDLKTARASGLLSGGGAVLGCFKGRLLTTDDLRPSLVTGGTRSGKGRGHVTPTLLSWPASVLVHDPKAELWRLTAGWRSKFSHALFMAPRHAESARWNPLAEIPPGPGELAQIQRLVAILADPGGRREDEAIWDKAASEILEAVILHVLYSAEDGDKTLLKVRELLADLDAAADFMLKTLHRTGPDGTPQTHPFIKTAVTGYAAMHDRFRTSVQGTARSYLTWLAGEDVERTLSVSDFSMGDLVCSKAPVSLYVQVSPADAAALRPLVRLIFYAASQALTVDETRDATGRLKRHRLLMVMDEFPLLGRLAFFEKSLRLMSGYGVKAMLVAQSLNDVVETYGPNNGILDNCHVFTAFAALDPLTQDKVSRLTGTILEPRISRSSPAMMGKGAGSVSRSDVERPLLEPGEVRALPDDEQLVFVAGQKPLRATKLKYDKREPFRTRARVEAPDQASSLDAPPAPSHPWKGRRAAGRDDAATLPLFKEVAAVMEDKKTVAKVADVLGKVAQEMAASEAALNHLQGRGDGED